MENGMKTTKVREVYDTLDELATAAGLHYAEFIRLVHSGKKCRHHLYTQVKTVDGQIAYTLEFVLREIED